MYNSVHLLPLEHHTHCFLWRDMENREPNVWVITRVNMGDKPAGAIAIEAKDRTADMFAESYPEAAKVIKDSSYVDDLVDSVVDLPAANRITSQIDHILREGGFTLKTWIFGGTGDPSLEVKRVVGVLYDPSKDVIIFQAHLNFSPKKRNVHKEPDLLPIQIPQEIPATPVRAL